MSGNVNQPAFAPVPASTVNISVSSSSQALQVKGTNVIARHVRLTNASANIMFVDFGPSSITTTTTTGMPVLPNSAIVVATASNYVAVIGTTGTLYATPGEGLGSV
jgi:hypothetical protein